MKRIIGMILAVAMLVGTISTVQAATFAGWQTEDGGGQYSSNAVISLSGSDGAYVVLYQPIFPQGDFSLSLRVNAETLQGFAIMLRSSLPFAGSTAGVNFELGARDGGSFTLSRYSNGWTWNVFALGAQENTWYTMKLSVQRNPFTVTAQVFDSNGNSVGSYSASDMTNLQFSDINYLGFGVLESGGSYTVSDITTENLELEGQLFVTPEYAWGGIVALSSCFIAYGVFGLRKRKAIG